VHFVATYSIDLFFGFGEALCSGDNGLPLCQFLQ
jgi:hypothetical protein